MIGYTKKHNLEGTLKAFTRVNPSDELSVICQQNGKYDILEYDELLNRNLSDKKDANGKLVYNLANMENYILRTKNLLRLASNVDDLNKLYQKNFKKIAAYDEEEEKTVEPDQANGYKFELAIGKYFQMCNQDKLKILLVDQKDEYACLKTDEDVDECKAAIFRLSQKYIDKTNFKQKFKGKKVEINFTKTLGENDHNSRSYTKKLDEYLINLDKNKSEVYID